MSKSLNVRSVLAAAVLLALACPAAGQAEEKAAARTVTVAKSFDNKPFSYHIELVAEKESFRVYRLTYPSPVHTATEQNNTIPAELYLPKDMGQAGTLTLRDGQAGTLTLRDGQAGTLTRRRPAVVCLHILDGNVELCQISCSSLAARGIPAVWFRLPYYGERAVAGGRHALAADPKLFTQAIAQAVEDVRRTVDVLASRPEVDPEKIGVMGISLGGFLAGTAAERDPRIARTALVLAGGDVLRIIHSCREARELSEMVNRLPETTKAEVERAIDALDPLQHADLLREPAKQGKVLMINATDDEVVPRGAAEKLAAALGMSNRVVWLEGMGHYTALAELPRALRTTVDFFAEDLPPDVKSAAPAAAASPHRTLAAILQQAGDLLTGEPKAGRCHVADLEVSLTEKNGKRIDGRLRIVRGPKPKFSVHVQVPGLAEAAAGQGEYPWMAAEKVVFKGVQPRRTGFPTRPARTDGLEDPSYAKADGLGNPSYLTLADPKQLAKLQMLSGLLTTVSIAPDVLDRWVKITEETSPQGPAIAITRKDRSEDYVRIKLLDDRATPKIATFAFGGASGSVVFRAWQINAAANDALFREPEGLPVKEVDAGDLARTFAAA